MAGTEVYEGEYYDEEDDDVSDFEDDELEDEDDDADALELQGKPGVGRSSVANGLLCESVAETNSGVGMTQRENATTIHVRKAGQFVLKVIDTPGLVQGDKVNSKAFEEIADSLSKRKVDVVLYVDRLDVYQIDQLDKHVLRAITQHFGADIWKRTILAISRGGVTPPAGWRYADFATKRAEILQAAVKQAGGVKGTPYVIMDNSSRCRSNENNEKILPDGTVWMTSLMDAIVSTALTNRKGLQIRYSRYNPNRSRLWLIPALVLAQFMLKRFILDPIITADGWRGDKHGDYDPETAREERLLAEARKAEAKRERERQKRIEEQIRLSDRTRAESLAQQATSSGFKNMSYEDDYDEDDDF